MIQIKKFIAADYVQRSIDDSEIETVFFSKDIIFIKEMKIDGKTIDAIWDAGTSINVLKRHPTNYKENGTVTVQSFKNIQHQKKFIGTIEIKGKRMQVEYILDSQLPYDALISTKTLNTVASSYDFKKGEIIYR